MPELLVSCQELSKAFGAAPLFERLSLGVFEGDHVGLVGPNGSGKSTLLKILAGLEEPSTGTRAARKRLRIGYVPQDPVFDPGATVAIEGDEALLDLLAEIATSLGAIPVRIAPGSKAAYHAAAVLAAGGLTALLDVVAAVAAPTGLDEAGALAIYGPLAAQALANARSMGTGPSLTGPAVRGDAGTVAAHLAAAAAAGPEEVAVYRALGLRQVTLATTRRGLAPEAAARLRAAFTTDP